MLRSISHVHNYVLRGTDGDIGRVGDFLFDDRMWTVRYVVANTGKWLPGRLVLISPAAVDTPDWDARVVPVRMTRGEVEAGPPLEEDEPVSRQKEIQLHTYYGWAPYWMAGPDAAAMAASEVQRARAGAATAVAEGDPHLRSANEVIGYRIQATDGEIGHVEDLVVDDDTWIVRYLVVDTRNWWPGKKVLVSPAWVDDIRWKDRHVAMDLTRERIRNGPTYDPSAPVNREYEVRLYDFHGRPYYWS